MRSPLRIFDYTLILGVLMFTVLLCVSAFWIDVVLLNVFAVLALIAMCVTCMALWRIDRAKYHTLRSHNIQHTLSEMTSVSLTESVNRRVEPTMPIDDQVREPENQIDSTNQLTNSTYQTTQPTTDLLDVKIRKSARIVAFQRS